MKHLKTLFVCTAFAALQAPAMAQGTLDDYNRAYSLRDKYSMRRVTGRVSNPAFSADGRYLDYETNTADSNLCWRLTLADGTVARRTPEPAKPATGNAPQPQGYWSETDDERSGEPVTSPDGKYRAARYGNNILITETATGRKVAESLDGSEGNYYSARIYWSPDSRKVAVCRIRTAPKHYIYYVESCPPDQFQPKLHKQEYQKPGDELPYKVPVIFDLATGRQLTADTALFPDEFGLEDLRWEPDSRELTFEYNQRGHKIYRLLGMSAADGRVRTIVEEKFPTYVNWTRIYRYHFADGRRLLWTSERDGYNHLYLYDKTTGKITRQLTRGAWYVRSVEAVDEENGVVYFSANGREGGQDPYFIHYYRVGLDGRHLVELTPEKAMHQAQLSPDRRYIVDTYSTIADAPVTVVRNAATGALVARLATADLSAIKANGWKAPEVFTAKGRDGKTDLWGLIYRPSNFDASKKYPVIDYIYSGPGSQYVPKSFMSYNWWATSLAELGFIVVQVDGMTTSFRSKAFEEVCYKNLQDAGLPDHIAWLQAAARRYPSLDLDRVGIYGCSAGGQEAMNAVLLHPEFYKAAYAASGCHDNRMDKIWWNEQWLGYPVDSSYVKASNIENARLLTRPLMLCWGELDDNVDPATTMKVVNALIKANKNFEMIVIPGAHHTMGELWGEHKRYDFFVRHLMNVTPPDWQLVKSDVRW